MVIQFSKDLIGYFNDGTRLHLHPVLVDPRPTEEELSARLAAILAEHNATHCVCGHEIGFGDIAWNNGSTEYGTGYCTIQIQCLACDRGIAKVNSWYPSIDDCGELLYVLGKDWE